MMCGNTQLVASSGSTCKVAHAAVANISLQLDQDSLGWMRHTEGSSDQHVAAKDNNLP